MNCRWVARDQPRVVVGRHNDPCDFEQHGLAEHCKGCLPCTEPHCRICRREHVAGTCAECLAETRASLWEIVHLTGALPAEAIAKGVESEAAMLWGPSADWERWGHVQASIRVGRLPADWAEVADDETHPLFVLGSWDAMARDVLDHDEPESRVTIAEAARYLDMQLTYLAGYADLPFEDLAHDLRRCLAHLEAVLHDGEQRDTGAPCMTCRTPLERVYGAAPSQDGWKCPRCRETSTDDQYRFAVMHLHREEADWLTDKEMQMRTGVKAGTVREWARRGSVGRKRDCGRVVYAVGDVETVAREKGMMSA